MGDRSAAPPLTGPTRNAAGPAPGSGLGSTVSATAVPSPSPTQPGSSQPQPRRSASTSLATPPPPPPPPPAPSALSSSSTPAAASSPTPRRRRSAFLSRLVHLPLRAVSSATAPAVRSVADFHIRPAEPHRKYNAGDHVLGAVVLAVVKPLNITHLTVSLRGLVRVFKDPSAAAAPLPADVLAGGGSDSGGGNNSSSSGVAGQQASSSRRGARAAARAATGGSGSGSGSGSGRSTSTGRTGSTSSTATAHHCLFRDEMVLCGAGWLQPGHYEFQFDLLFPATDGGRSLPSSIDFERGSIAYVVTATLTRPATVAPVLSCDRRIALVDAIDVGTVSRPRPRTISLEPITRHSRRRALVVTTSGTTPAPAGTPPPPPPPRSPVLPSDLCSTLSVDSGGSGGSRSRSRGSSSAATTAGVSRPALSLGPASTLAEPTAATTTTTTTTTAAAAAASATNTGAAAPTITATIETLKGGCLPGDTVGVRIAVQHVKRIKSLHGVIVTLFRQGRIDSAPPALLMRRRSGDTAAGGGGSPAAEESSNGSNDGILDAGAGSNAASVAPATAATWAADDDGAATGTSTKANSYPKSKTGLAGLSLTSAGSCSVFRKDLSQSFSPLIIDPRTLQSTVTASVRVPEDAFATIRGVPGDMIRFTYQLEILVDLGGKLASLLQSGGEGGPAAGNGPAADACGGSGGGGGGSGGGGGGGDLLGPSLGGDGGGSSGDAMGTLATLLRGRHMVDTDRLRRQKGVVAVVFEVVVGTTDSSRRRGRWTQPSQPQLPLPAPTEDDDDGGPGSSTQLPQPPMWYPEDAKSAGPSTKPPPVWPGPSAPAPAAAPVYTPTPAMEAAAAQADVDLPEKERIRRAELRLLPSQPPATAVAAGAEAAAGMAGPSGWSGGDALPTAPDPSLVEGGGGDGGGGGSPSAPPLDTVGVPSSSVFSPYAPPAASFSNAPATGSGSEDKQELERWRLLAEASAPPAFPDEGGGPSGSGGAGNDDDDDDRGEDPSAPALDEEDTLGLVGGAGAHDTDQASAADDAGNEGYGRQYSYGPGAAPPAEPLPRYER